MATKVRSILPNERQTNISRAVDIVIYKQRFSETRKAILKCSSMFIWLRMAGLVGLRMAGLLVWSWLLDWPDWLPNPKIYFFHLGFVILNPWSGDGMIPVTYCVASNINGTTKLWASNLLCSSLHQLNYNVTSQTVWTLLRLFSIIAIQNDENSAPADCSGGMQGGYAMWR